MTIFFLTRAPTRGLGKIRFHDFNMAYNGLDLPNIRIFKTQIETLKEFLVKASPSEAQARDIDFLLTLGEFFTLVAYGQLIIENSLIYKVDNDLVDRIFDFMVRDFSKFALQLYSKPGSTQAQMELCLGMIKKPALDEERFKRVWEKYVYPLKGAYQMNE